MGGFRSFCGGVVVVALVEGEGEGSVTTIYGSVML